jgi:hypothetical protein
MQSFSNNDSTYIPTDLQSCQEFAGMITKSGNNPTNPNGAFNVTCGRKTGER